MIVCDALLMTADNNEQTESQGHLRSQLQLGQNGPVGFGQQSIFLASAAVAIALASLVASDTYEAAKV